MSFLLVRVDDRLLHGQVAFGWGSALAPRAYLIVDDRVAGDAWEREAFAAAAPGGSRVEVVAVEAFAARWREWPEAGATIVLLAGVETLSRLWRAGVRPAGGIDLGGLHGRPGTREVLRYLHLTPEEIGLLRAMLGEGALLFAQELPGGRRHDTAELGALLASARDEAGS